MNTPLDTLVDDWLPLPDVASLLDLEFGKVRGLVRDRYLIGVKRTDRDIFMVPAAFLVTGDDGLTEVLDSLRGTVLQLVDRGFDDAEIIEWLFTVEPTIDARPIDSLLRGRKSEARRLAQLLQ